MFDFDTQLAMGNKGEEFFIKCYEDRKPQKANKREFDFIIDCDKSVELKTDTYAMDKTDNFFMEQYGSFPYTENHLGGPWRGKRDGVNFFVYLFISQRTFFWFEPISLCVFLDKNLSTYKKRYIKNKGWTALGFLVNRDSLNSLCIQKDTFDKNGRKLV